MTTSLPQETYPDFDEIEDEMVLHEAELILFDNDEELSHTGM